MSQAAILDQLAGIIETRRSGDVKHSYVAKRLEQGCAKISQKFGEEAVETVIAAIQQDRDAIIAESADMLFHWLLLLADANVKTDEVWAELKRREGESGLDEKARRKLDKQKG